MCNSRSIWGTVCNTQWTKANTRVVCRNLGYINEEGIVIPHYRYLFHSFYASFIPGNWGMLGTVVAWDVCKVRQLSCVCTCTDGSTQCSGCVVYSASMSNLIQLNGMKWMRFDHVKSYPSSFMLCSYLGTWGMLGTDGRLGCVCKERQTPLFHAKYTHALLAPSSVLGAWTIVLVIRLLFTNFSYYSYSVMSNLTQLFITGDDGTSQSHYLHKKQLTKH